MREKTTGALDFPSLISRNVPPPISVQIETTTRCNLRCIMCPKGANDEVMGDLSPAILPNIDPLIASAWEVRPHGFGETFLSRELMPLLRRCGESATCISIVTNGTLIDEDRARLLIDVGVSNLFVSLDAADPDLFRTIRKVSLEKILTNVRRLVEIKRERGSALPRVIFQMVGMSTNVHDLPAMVELAASCGAEAVNVVALTEFELETARDHGIESLVRDPERARPYLLRARSLASSLGIRLELAPLYAALLPPDSPPADPGPMGAPRGEAHSIALFRRAIAKGRAGDWRAFVGFARKHWSRLTGPKESALEAESARGELRTAPQRKVRCRDPWDATVVNVKGEVNPCCMCQRVMGNVRDKSFAEIWEGDAYRTFREELLSDDPPQECRTCAKAGWYQPHELTDWVEPGVNDDFGIQLGTGWGHVTDGVLWSRKHALLRFANSGRRRLELTLSSWPDAGHPLSQRGHVRVNGSQAGTFEISNLEGQTVSFPVPALDSDELVVEIDCETEHVPHAIFGNGDTRRLGIGLRRARLTD